MIAEFVGGPIDGQITEVPDDVKLHVIFQPAMSAAEFVRMENAPPLMDFVNRRPREHGYMRTDRIGVQSGARLFVYSGERAVK